MVPLSLVSFILFLALIAPGLAYELLWERRHPAVERSAFREASRTVLTSLIFTALSVGVLALVRKFWPGLIVDTGELIRNQKGYIAVHYSLLIWTVVVQVGLALLLVVLAHCIPGWLAKLPSPWTKWMPNWLCARTRGVMSSDGIWFDVFRRKAPPGTAPWVHLRLTDGTHIRGYVAFYTAATKPENREIAVEKPKDDGDMRLVDPSLNPANQILRRRWNYIVVGGDQITYMRVQYLKI
jgi:hypothetical protein